MHNRQGLTLKLLYNSFADFDLWPIYLMGFTILMPLRPIMAYFTLNLRNLGFSTLHTNLLTVPAYTIFVFQLIFWSRISERINNRFLIVAFCAVWLMPLFIALATLPSDVSPWGRYAITVLIIGYPYVHSILGKHLNFLVVVTCTNMIGCSRSHISKCWIRPDPNRRQRVLQHVRADEQHHRIKRKLPITSLVTFEFRPLTQSQIYRADDAPLYRRGNKAIIGIVAWNFVFAFFIKYYYFWRNKKKEEAWSAMSQEEKDTYLATTKDEGSRRLDFRFAH